MSLKPRTVISLFALVVFATIQVVAQQTFKIARIEFEGLRRLSLEEMISKTELKVGQQFELSNLDAAAQRLVDSGLFKNVAYKTKPAKDQITITFVVEEAQVATSKVVFDNFIWFSDNELIAAVQRDIPSFTGSAPDNGDTVDRITKSLQRFLHENKFEATVSYMAPQDSLGSSTQEHVFSVTGIPMPICTLHFPGASNITGAKLIESSKSLIGADYSYKFVSIFSKNTLFPLYREVGQLKAEFSPPLAKPEESATCKMGVDLTIPVDEGLVYKFGKADWVGSKALTPQELDTVLAMQSGQPANGLKLDKAAGEIQKAYGRKGYLTASVRSAPTFDDAAQIVNYRLTVIEGPQFRMGRFITKGFTEAQDKMLHERWGLKPGDVFDQEYSTEFSQKQINELMRSIFMERRSQGKPAQNIKWDNQTDRNALTVDVVLSLSN